MQETRFLEETGFLVFEQRLYYDDIHHKDTRSTKVESSSANPFETGIRLDSVKSINLFVYFVPLW